MYILRPYNFSCLYFFFFLFWQNSLFPFFILKKVLWIYCAWAAPQIPGWRHWHERPQKSCIFSIAGRFWRIPPIYTTDERHFSCWAVLALVTPTTIILNIGWKRGQPGGRKKGREWRENVKRTTRSDHFSRRYTNYLFRGEFAAGIGSLPQALLYLYLCFLTFRSVSAFPQSTLLIVTLWMYSLYLHVNTGWQGPTFVGTMLDARGFFLFFPYQFFNFIYFSFIFAILSFSH